MAPCLARLSSSSSLIPACRPGKIGGRDVAGQANDDGSVLQGVDDGSTVAVEDERLPPRKDHVAPVAGLGEPDGAADGGDLQALAVVDAVDGTGAQLHRLDIENGLHGSYPAYACAVRIDMARRLWSNALQLP